MPIPTPNNDEDKNEFINRCMSDNVMQEYDDKQRYAICETKFEEKNTMKTNNEKRHIKEIIEDDKTITIVYGKSEEWEGIKISDSEDPADDTSEVLPESVEENDGHMDKEDEDMEKDEELVEDEIADEEESEDGSEEVEDEEDEGEYVGENADEEEHLDEEQEEELEDEEEEEEEDRYEDDEDKKKRTIWDRKDKTEKRFFTIETRVKKKGKRNVVEGHAAVYGKLSEDLGGFREMIQPGAFDSVLGNDVRAFFNHDPNFLLARTSSGTLRLSTDKKGLKYEFDVPDTTAGRDLLVSMKRGDITQSSFAFQVETDSWKDTSKGEIRTIEKVSRLFDVSPVSIPAYPDTNDLAIAQRSRMINKDKNKMKNERDFEYRMSLLELKINILKRK
jgi:HK97 family phage prohead protease